MSMQERDQKIEEYCDESIVDLATRLVDAEDELEDIKNFLAASGLER